MDFYNAVLIVFVFIIVLGVFKGFGENRSIIVFRDYDDLGLTFLVPTVDLQAKLIHCLHRILIRFTQPLWA